MGCCKVGAVTEKYDLTVSTDSGEVDQYLVARWLGKNGHHEIGVRKLSDWFNKKLLREVYLSNGRSVTDVRIESEYEVLSGDDGIKKGEIIDDLKSNGIDGEELVGDFVSRSTMRRHLTDCLGVSKDVAVQPTNDRGWELDRIQYSKEHLLENVKESITSLSNKNQLPGGDDARINIEIFLTCPQCTTQVRLETALERGYICQEHSNPPTAVDAEITQSLD